MVSKKDVYKKRPDTRLNCGVRFGSSSNAQKRDKLNVVTDGWIDRVTDGWTNRFLMVGPTDSILFAPTDVQRF